MKILKNLGKLAMIPIIAGSLNGCVFENLEGTIKEESFYKGGYIAKGFSVPDKYFVTIILPDSSEIEMLEIGEKAREFDLKYSVGDKIPIHSEVKEINVHFDTQKEYNLKLNK